jgi:uncharacterized membrane protein HdeD (DUF308 family)
MRVFCAEDGVDQISRISRYALIRATQARAKLRRFHHTTEDHAMSTTTPTPQDVRAALGRALHEHWGLFLAEGIILVILGLLAIIVPPLASLAVTIFIGWLFVISGIAGLIMTFMARRAPGFWWSLISAVIALIAGALLLWQPVLGVLSLTFVLIAFFLIDGILSIILAIEHRRELVGRWGWILLSGIVDLIIAIIIWAGLPGTAAWALGLLVGIDLVFGGTALIMVALHARRGAAAAA